MERSPRASDYLAHARGTFWSTRASTTALPPRHRHRRTRSAHRSGLSRPGRSSRRRNSSGAVVVEIGAPAQRHLALRPSGGSPAVKVGDVVVTGQVVGDVGMTGVTTGPHLHFAIYEAGVPVDPVTVLPPKGMRLQWPYRFRFRRSCLPSWAGVPVRSRRPCRSCRHWPTEFRQGGYERGRPARTRPPRGHSAGERRTRRDAYAELIRALHPGSAAASIGSAWAGRR